MEHWRVLIVDDHPVVCEGLRTFLEGYEDIEVVGTAHDGREGLEQLRRLKPDCAVVDLKLPDMSGVEAIGLYLQENPALGIVVYSGYTEEVFVYQALQAGARAYVFKGAPVSVLATALREVQHGGYWLSTELNPAIVKRYLMQAGRAPDAVADYQRLSLREQQVFTLLARGKSLREIGAQLFISTKTASKHQVAIKKKLQLKNAAEMALYAMRLGLGE